MSAEDLLFLSAGLLSIFAVYWLLDIVTRREALARFCERAGIPLLVEGSTVAVLSLLGGWFWRWSMLPEGEIIGTWAMLLVAPLVWKTTTQDVDVAIGDVQRVERGLLILSLAGLVFSPAALALLLWVMNRRFSVWLHHASLSLRHIQLLFAFCLAWLGLEWTPLARLGSQHYMFGVLTLHASHYWVTVFAKGWMGGSLHGWVWDNRLHDLAASAYSWGWARFVPEGYYLAFVRLLKRFDRPAQAVAFLFEGLAPLILLDVQLGTALITGWIAFHLVVFVASGILFLEWILANAALLYLMYALTDGASVMGFEAMLLGCLFMAIFPFRGVLWQARPLAWWDTPWTQRIEWRVTGESGKVYALRNDFMCPHERLYGRIHGIFMFPRPMVGFHLGEVFRRDLRDEILASRGEPERLAAIQKSHGIDTTAPELRERHIAYLKRFFSRLNKGAIKFILPKGLRWLKYPGGQCYYWGDLPRYSRQEPIKSVEAVYKEEFYDGQGFRKLDEQSVMTVEIPDEAPPAVEITERDVESLFNQRGMGRLLVIPSWVPKPYLKNKGVRI